MTFTATVTATAPTGTVNFTDGGVSITGCSAVAFAAGSGNVRTATCLTSSLSAATHSIVANYSGDATNVPSASAALSQVVKAASTTTLASSANPSAVGASVTFTASVTGLAPTGNVNFTNGGVSIAGCSAVALAGSGNTRTAACSTSALAAGTRSIVAAYGGDAGNLASTSSTLSQVVKAASTTTLASSLNPSTSGANVTFTATVTATAPTGTVNFTDGGVSIAGCSAVALAGSGNTRTAACSTSTLSVATHSIVANYSGDAGNVPSASAALSQVVNTGGGGTSTNVALASNGGVATASSTYVVSMFPVSAVNNGDRAGLGFAAGGVWVDGTPNVFPDWVQINFSGSKTIDHVIVYSMQDNNSSPVDPSNTLTFTLYGLTDFQVQGWNGSAWVTLGTVTGNNLVKRTVNFAPTATDRIRVNVTNALAGYSRVAEIEAWSTGGGGPVATTTTLASSANPSAMGASVTFTASVTGLAPTGNVNFTNGGVSIAGCSAVALAGSGNTRTATCSTSALAAGTSSIAAAYGGDAGNLTSTSSTLSQVVKAASTTTLASSLNPSTSGASVTFTATVTATAPTGTVNFTDGGVSITGCSAVAFAAGSGNVRTATCLTSSLSAATHSIVANYSGDAGNVPSASAALSQVVNTGGGGQINVALASNGGVATASSTFVVSMFPVSAVNNGDRAGLGFAAGGVWVDGTSNVFPDWVQINFSGSKTIDHVIVYSMQDNNSTPVDPPATMTFSLYGLTDFQVQGWNGSAWVTLGTVTGNNLVKRTVNFAPTATDRIRVNVTSALAGYSRVAEIEAWGN